MPASRSTQGKKARRKRIRPPGSNHTCAVPWCRGFGAKDGVIRLTRLLGLDRRLLVVRSLRRSKAWTTLAANPVTDVRICACHIKDANPSTFTPFSPEEDPVVVDPAFAERRRQDMVDSLVTGGFVAAAPEAAAASASARDDRVRKRSSTAAGLLDNASTPVPPPLSAGCANDPIAGMTTEELRAEVRRLRAVSSQLRTELSRRHILCYTWILQQSAQANF